MYKGMVWIITSALLYHNNPQIFIWHRRKFSFMEYDGSGF